MAKRQNTARQATKKRRVSTPRKAHTTDVATKKETERLKRELAEALERQKATGEILAAISQSTLNSTSGLASVLEKLLEAAIRLCGATRGHIFRYDGEFLRFVAASGAAPAFREWLRTNDLRPSRRSVSERAALTRKVCHIPDVLADPEYGLQELVQQQYFRSALAVPMLKDNNLLGVIVILKPRVESFTDKQIELVSTFADQAVVAFENTRLFDETREALERQTATADILKVIAGSPSDVQPVFEAIAASANRLLGGFSTAVFRFIGEMAHLEAFTPTNPAADKVLKAGFPSPLAAFEPFEMAEQASRSRSPTSRPCPDRRSSRLPALGGFAVCCLRL